MITFVAEELLIRLRTDDGHSMPVSTQFKGAVCARLDHHAGLDWPEGEVLGTGKARENPGRSLRPAVGKSEPPGPPRETRG